MHTTSLHGRLTVRREALIDALTLIARQYRPRGEDAILSFDEANLLIDLGGITVVVPASGFWRGQMRYPGLPLLKLRNVMPEGNPLLLDVENGSLHIGGTVMRGKWQSSWSSRVELPMNASFPMLLALRYRYKDEEIEQSGLVKPYRRAWQRADRCISHAALALKPFDIPEARLRDWIENQLRGNSLTH